MLPLAKPILAPTAKDLMSADVATIPCDMGMQAAARWLARMHVSGAPVVDEQGRCIGVLSSSDFVACCAANRTSCAKHRAEANCGPCAFSDCVGSEWQMDTIGESVEGLVRDHMTADPVTAGPDTPLVRLAQMLVNAQVHRLVIVDERQHPLGIVSMTDIVAALARAAQDR